MYKDNIYNSFKCTADKCSLTCCRGWAVKVENESYEKWEGSDETRYLCDNTSFREQDGEVIRQMKEDACQACVMLDSNGLCEIVKRHGEEMLSETCACFPRKNNNIEDLDITEYSLSGACPEVLRLIRENEHTLNNALEKRVSENDELPMEYRIRDAVIGLLRLRDICLEDRIILSFSMLHECLECEYEEDVYPVIDIYDDAAKLKELFQVWHDTEFDKREALVEVFQTLLDMTQLYKEETMYKPYLHDIAEFVERLEEDGDELKMLLHEWQEFKTRWEKDSVFYENVLVSEIYGDCISEDIEYLTETFQGIVMEYIMTRVSVFMREKILGRQLSAEEVDEYLSLFIRMIGHNTDGMEEYWLENFEELVVELEYLYLVQQ